MYRAKKGSGWIGLIKIYKIGEFRQDDLKCNMHLAYDVISILCIW